METDDSQDSRGGERSIFYSTLALPSAHKHLDIYLQLCMWDDYHIFNRTTCIYQTTTQWDLPPYRITIWLIDDVMLAFFCLHDLMLANSCYSNLRQETGGFKLTSAITLLLQANQLTNCASHPTYGKKEYLNTSVLQ